MAIDLNRIENLQIDEGTLDSPFILKDNEVIALYRLALSNNRKINISGVVNTTTGTILKYEAYQIRKAWPELTILAREVTTQDWTVQLLSGTITELESTTLLATNISIETLEWQINDVSLNVISGSYGEQDVRNHLHFDNTTGRIYYDAPTSNAGWIANVELAFWPSYIEDPEPEDFRTVLLDIRAIAVTSVTITAPSRIDENATVSISLAPYPANNTKTGGIRYSLRTTYGSLSPSSGTITTRDTFTYYAPPFSAVPYDEDSGGKFYTHTFIAGFYMFGSTTTAGTAETTVLMRNTEFSVEIIDGVSSLIEGQKAEFVVDGYQWDELQKTMVVDEISLVGITEEELRNRVVFESGPFFSMYAPIDNATYSANVLLYIAPPGADPIGERAKVFNMSLRAIGLTSVTISPQTIGQNMQSIISIAYRPLVHTKGTLSYSLRCDAVTFISKDDNAGVYTLFSSDISSEGHDATVAIYSEYIGTGTPLIQSVNKLYVQDIYFNVTFDGVSQRTISIDEGDTIQCYTDILHISELRREITVNIIEGADLIDANWIIDRLHFSDDVSTDLIWFDYPKENISWNATISIRFIAMYVPDGQEPPYDQVVSINIDSRAVAGVEWQDEANNFSNYQIATAPYRISKYFRLVTLPYNNTKQRVLESAALSTQNPFSVGALATGIIMNGLVPYGRFSTIVNNYGDWTIYGYVSAFANNTQFGTVTNNVVGKTIQSGTPSTTNVIYPIHLKLYDRLTDSYVELRKVDDLFVDNYTCMLGDEPVTPSINRNIGKYTMSDATTINVIEGAEDLDTTCFYIQVGGKRNDVDYEKVICSHFNASTTDISESGNADTIINYDEDNKFIIRISNTTIGVEDITQETTESLTQKIEAYVSNQYDNGTPIVIYYPLAITDSTDYANTLYRDYVFFKTSAYHIYTANNPANQCSVEFINNSTIATSRTIFGDNQSYQGIDVTTNSNIEKLLVNNIRVNSNEVSSIPFFSGTPTSIDQYDEDGNLLLDSNGNPEKGEVNIWENFSGKYEEWTDSEPTQITWNLLGTTNFVQPSYNAVTGEHTLATIEPLKVYTNTQLTNEEELYGFVFPTLGEFRDNYSSDSHSTIRKMKKFVFDSNTAIQHYFTNDSLASFTYAMPSDIQTGGTIGDVLSTHFTTMEGWNLRSTSKPLNLCLINRQVYAQLPHEILGTTSSSTNAEVVAAFKNYFDEQIAAGTPVTIYYPMNASSVQYDKTYYTRGSVHHKYTISKLLNESDAEYDSSGNVTKPNSFNNAFVYNEDGTIPTQFFLSRYIPGWNQDDNSSIISMAKGLQSQPRTITKDRLISNGCYYKNSKGELKQISSIYYGPFLAYLWLAYITYGTINLKNVIGVGASKISSDGQIFADDSGTELTPTQTYGSLFILNNALLNSTTYMNYDFNIFGVNDRENIATEPIASYKISSIDVGSIYTEIELADSQGNAVNYVAKYPIDYYSINSCYSKTGYSEDNYKDSENLPVISGYGTNSSTHNDSRHTVRCLNVENMWGCGSYIVGGTGFVADSEDNTIVHPILWNPQDEEQTLNDISTWDRLDDINVLNANDTWDVGSFKYYNSQCAWADEPAGERTPYRGYNVYGRPSTLDVNSRYNWSTGNYHGWTEDSDTSSMCGIGQTSLLLDGMKQPIIDDGNETYQLIEYIENIGSAYIDTEVRRGTFVHDIQLTATSGRQLMGHSASNPYWGRNNNGYYELSGSQLNKKVGDRDIVTYSATAVSTYLAIDNLRNNQAASANSANNNYQVFALGGGFNVKAKLYNLDIYNESGSLIARMLPCYKMSDGKVGMYDIIRNRFFGSANASTFVKGPNLASTSLLDEDRYFKTDSLVLSGRQNIDTNLKLSQSTKFVIDFESSHTNTRGSYFGGTKEYVGNKTGLNLYISTDNKLCCEGSSGVIELSNADAILPNIRHTIEVEINDSTLIAKIDGTQTYIGSSYELDKTNSYSLFMINEYGSLTTNKSFIGKIYSFKIYKNNRLSRDYTSVFDKKDKLFGLYDKILKKFSSISNMLPANYQAVEYIESTGQQYIDTNINVGPNIVSEIDWQVESLNNQSDGWSNLYGYASSSAGTPYAVWGNSGVLKFHRQSDFVSINLPTTRTTTTLQSNATALNKHIYIFSVGPDCGAAYVDARNTYKLYGLKIWNNNALVRDFIPCYRTSDSKPGLYDIINNVFYTNDNTSASVDFIVGSNIILLGSNQALQPVDSIKFSSGQYINTGWKYKPGSTVKLVARKLVAGLSNIFGNNETNNAFLIEIANSSNYPALSIGSAGSKAISTATTIDKNYTLEATVDTSSFSFTAKGNSIATLSVTGSSGATAQTNTCFLGGYRDIDGSLGSYTQNNQIYLCQIYEGNTLVKHFVPMYNLVTETYGMYELVDNVFYENSGTGTLGGTTIDEVEYVQNGTSAVFTDWNFDTGIKFKDTGKITVDLNVSTISGDGNNRCINGSLSTTTAGSTYLSYSTDSVSGVTLTSRTTAGSKVTWVYTYNTTDDATVHIAGNISADTGTYQYKRVTIYGSDGLTVLADLIPISSGGFYNLINSEVIVNNGSTSSNVGPKVNKTVPGDPGIYFKEITSTTRVFGTL